MNTDIFLLGESGSECLVWLSYEICKWISNQLILFLSSVLVLDCGNLFNILSEEKKC